MLPGADLNGHLPPDNPQPNLVCSLPRPRLVYYLSEWEKLNIGLHFFSTPFLQRESLESTFLDRKGGGQKDWLPEILGFNRCHSGLPFPGSLGSYVSAV